MGYSTAPMSRLFLNGVAPAKSYQKSLDTLSKRHHIRLWNQPDANIWLAAASEDVGITVRGMHVTHAIDKDIDNERAKIVNDLWFTGCVESASLLRRDSLRPAGDKNFSLATDGEIAVLRMNSCEHPRVVADSYPAVHQRPRVEQALLAVGNDLARANPVTIGLVAFRTAAEFKQRRTGFTEDLQARGWLRTSFLDTPTELLMRQSSVATSQQREGSLLGPSALGSVSLERAVLNRKAGD
jgi:hypothetical protein